MKTESEALWKSAAEAELLAGRAEGFWNLDYFERVILPLLALPHGARVLDAGAGNGALTFLLARLRPDLDLTAVDITPELVAAGNAEAAKRGIQNVRFAAGDAYRLDSADATFDAVVCQTLLGHVAEPARVVAEMSRVLREGGSLMAAEFNIINIEWPVESAEPVDETIAQTARYTELLVRGYRLSGQGDLRVGAKVAFLATAAGLDVVDCRINDRIAHAFLPVQKPAQETAVSEARSWVNLFEDQSYRAWLASAMTAAGGTEQDVDGFLHMLRDGTRDALRSGGRSFVWLINPVLVVTVARKRANTTTV